MTTSRRQFTLGSLSAAAFLSAPGRSFANENLLRKAIPASGETVPVIGLGTNRYGVGQDTAARAPLRDALRTFNELGGTLIDTAPGYRTSELVLGDLIDELDIRKSLFLATKVDRANRSASRAGMEASFSRLQTDSMDLMQVHNFKGWQDSIPLMREWKAEGRIRYIGITSSRSRQYELMEQVMRDHDLDFIQINYSLAGQTESAERILPLAADRNMAVLVNRPFGGGSIFRKLGGQTMPSWAGEFDCDSWGQFLLKYVVSHEAVTAAIPGMTKVKHVVDNMGAAHGRLPNPEQRRQQEEYFGTL